jgi:putative hydrolase of the HAD superfamily
MLNALLFDMGGTLDSDGVHWLDRFDQAYAAAGVTLARETLRAAFDEAEGKAAVDEIICTAGLEAMVDRHVGWQLDALNDAPEIVTSMDGDGRALQRLRAAITQTFVDPVRRKAAINARMLADLKSLGYVLGVVSNGCGNVDVLCEELGYRPFLSLIVDSRRVGLFKPDPAIYRYAAGRLGFPPSEIMMIGDSFERDVRPAASIGMKTAWLRGVGDRACPDPLLADACLNMLSELPEALEPRARTVA